ncbi:glycosyltransferase [Halomonas saccharevitans]|uniref:Glycosyltransferase involved in cell wall bisynthesis n=1 Tax=Halomonas saccharevitans TaxID=416872 RepID=A0A1I7CK55_9GAMM|nr:glycosyltransferase [Halomonas saccharevitans]SFT99796.1 Glycosyltransferase involved in cell wall bisynthesis [Halomonas saccharevitans]
MQPLVSVIVPIYNVASYLDCCLNSIRGQSYQRLEIIMVEDCSTDDSVSLAERHLVDPRVRLLRHARNAGLSAARNTGIEAATGDFVLFVDSDDAIAPALVKSCLTHAQASGADVVVFDFVPFEDGDALPETGRVVDTLGTESLDAVQYFRLHHFAWLKFIRADLLRDPCLRFPIGLYYEDWPFHWQLGFVSNSMHTLAGQWYYYRQRGSSITASRGRKLLDQFKVQRLVLEMVRQQGGRDAASVLYQKVHGTFWTVLIRVENRLLPEAIMTARRLRGELLGVATVPPRDGRTALMALLLALPPPLSGAGLRLVRSLKAIAASFFDKTAVKGKGAERMKHQAVPHPQRVLHIVGRMDRAGAETMLMNYYRAIDRTRLQLDFLVYTTEEGDYDAEIRTLGGEIIQIEGDAGWLKRAIAMTRIFRQSKWCAVHAHTNFSNIFPLFAAVLARIPIRISHAHVTDVDCPSLAQSVYQAVAPVFLRLFATHKVACGERAAALLYRPGDNVTILPNAIESSLYLQERGEASQAVRDELLIGAETRVVLQVARLDKVKNQLFIIEVARRLKEQCQDFVTLLAGRGEMEGQLREAVARHRLNDHVKFLGVRDDIPQLLNAADVFVLPSFVEGFPVVLVEAQAAGVPCLVSDRVSTEVDLGMGLVSFYAVPDALESADAGRLADEWADALIACRDKDKPSTVERRVILESTGYCASGAMDRLARLYQIETSCRAID